MSVIAVHTRSMSAAVAVDCMTTSIASSGERTSRPPMACRDYEKYARESGIGSRRSTPLEERLADRLDAAGAETNQVDASRDRSARIVGAVPLQAWIASGVAPFAG